MRGRSVFWAAGAAVLALPALRAGGQLEPALAPAAPIFAPRARSRVRRLRPQPAPPPSTPVNPLAALDVSRELDALEQAAVLHLDGRSWRVGLAADRQFKYFFVAFTKGGATRLAPLSRPRDALGSGGALLRADADHLFHVRLKLKLTAPVRGSVVRVWQEHQNPRDAPSWSSGELLDMLERRARFLRADGGDYYVALLSDIDPATGRPDGGRSVLFFQEGRFFARAWALPAGDVLPGRPVTVLLGATRLTLARRGRLLVVYPSD